ncbi:helix-turn-helix domain-containing protein [Rhizobium ruizarguesonis]
MKREDPRTRVPPHPQIFFSPAKHRPRSFSRLPMKNPKSTPGRPPHHPTDMQRRLVQMLAAQGIPQAEICRVLDVSEKTLRKRYRKQLNIGAAKLEAALIGQLLRIAGGKGAVAFKAIRFTLQARFGWSQYVPPPRP